jgi:hypothetical protein
MAHFAEIGLDNKVLRVIVVDDKNAPTESLGAEFCRNLLGGTWLQTSYNTIANTHLGGGTPFRKNYAGIGFAYDKVRDAFIPPVPFESWILNEDTCQYEAPIAKPDDGKIYVWDEATVSWIETALE